MEKRIVIHLGKITYEEIKGQYKYILTEPYVYHTGIRIKKAIMSYGWELKTTGRLYIEAGYRWDGATGCPDTDEVMRGSLVHDPLCEAYNKGGLTKRWVKEINDIFVKICKEDGMGNFMCGFYRRMLKLYWRLK